MSSAKINGSTLLARLSPFVLAGLGGLTTGSALAQGGMEEVIVTAQKRAENIQDVPIAITSITGDDLRERNVTDMLSMAQTVPSVVFSTSNGEARISMRGIAYDGLAGGSAESRVAYHVDGVYIATTGEIFGTFYDVERVEALRGPQGTLFGRNAIAGSMNVITRAPTPEFGGYIQADAGNYDRVMLQGAVSGPLAESVSGRIAFKTEDREGYEDNIPNNTDVNDLDTKAVRGKLLIEPRDDLTIDLSADYFRESDKQGFIFLGMNSPDDFPVTFGEAFGGTASDGNPRHDYSNNTPGTERRYWGVSADVNWEINDSWELVAITSYRKQEETFDIDVDLTSIGLLDGLIDDDISQFSQEFRIQNTFDRGQVMAGLFYFTRDFYSKQIYNIAPIMLGLSADPSAGSTNGGHLLLGGTSKSTSYAAFVDGTYEINDWFALTLGGRYSWERKERIDEFNQFLFTPYDGNYVGTYLNDDNIYSNFSPRVTATATLSENSTLYATFSRGFRSGGINLGYQTDDFSPEELMNYEVGFKTEFLDNRVRLNTSAFFYDYEDLQVSKASATVGNTIQNAAGADIYGADFELLAVPVEGLTIDFSLSLLHTEFTEYDTLDPSRPSLGMLDLSGNSLPQAPEYTVSYGAQYTFQAASLGEFTVRGEGRTVDDRYFDQFNREVNYQERFTVLNAILSWKSVDEKFYGSAYVRNIEDETSKNGSLVFSGITAFNIAGSYDPPRTYGVSLGMNF